jgi:hypothetical protein
MLLWGHSSLDLAPPLAGPFIESLLRKDRSMTMMRTIIALAILLMAAPANAYTCQTCVGGWHNTAQPACS